MISLPCYIHITPASMHPYSLSKEDYAEAKRTWLCSGCNRPIPDTGPVNVQIQEKKLKGSLSFIQGVGLGMALKSFLGSFGEERVSRDLRVGTVKGPLGEVSDWATFTGRRRIIVRATENVSHRKCTQCGRDVYFGMGKKYIFPEPEPDAELFDTGWGGILVPSALGSQLRLEEYSDIFTESLGVSNEPVDGLVNLWA